MLSSTLRCLPGQARLLSRTAVIRADPWPLPHTPEHLASTASQSDNLPGFPAPASKQDRVDNARVARHLCARAPPGDVPSELREYDKLLDEADWDIYYWATEERTPPEHWAGSAILEKLKIHARNEGKVVRLMPALP
ncbi:mitochondrial protein [Mycena olivaceomarginata]|nr:mitochondrial protein [Mycena olivaceomarginata]